VVVDEASQGVEVAMLIAVKLGCQRLIMVGDPKQLPATCFSTVAQSHQYDRSLFERLQLSQYRVNMLQKQYRMHPSISSFPSQNFYEGKLLNVRELSDFERDFPTPWSKITCFGPVAFFHLKGSHRESQQSLVNDDEADFVVQLFRLISEVYPGQNWNSKIAVISPYAEQVQLIRVKFRAFFNLKPKSPCPVDVNTVDGFQGREKDCIIVSVVRANMEDSGIGFVRDKRRMNVAFTRARLNLWVVGHAEVLKKNADWRSFIEQQQAEARLLRVSKPFETFLGRYLSGWFDRHPELEKPDSELMRAAVAAEQSASIGDTSAADPIDGELSDAPMDDDDDVGYRPDVEEVSDGIGSAASDDDGAAGEGGEPEKGGDAAGGGNDSGTLVAGKADNADIAGGDGNVEDV